MMLKHVVIWMLATFGAVGSPDAIIYVEEGYSKGSGFFIEDGYVITAGHVSKGERMVVFDGRDYLSAELIKLDRERDLALLLTEKKDHPFYTIAEHVEQGEPVYTIGSSRSAGREFYRIEGRVSELSRWVRTR